MSKVKFMDGPLRRPAVVRVGFGYERQSFAVDVDDMLESDRPETERCADIIGHLEVDHGQA